MIDGFDTYEQLIDYYKALIAQLPEALKKHIQIADQPHPKLGTPCWLWTGRLNRNGYGRVRIDGREPVAHRAVFERLVGPIPPKHLLDHLCENHPCTNPYHGEPVTPRVNTLRGKAVLFQKKVAAYADSDEATEGADVSPATGDAGDRPEVNGFGEYDPRVCGDEPSVQRHDTAAAWRSGRCKMVGVAILDLWRKHHGYVAIGITFFCFLYALWMIRA